MQHTQVDNGSTIAVPVLSIVYSSSAAVPFSEVDLALLLAVSRSNNEPSSVTGLLLYRDGQFMQALEGPEVAVRRTLDRVSADPRHTDLQVLEEVRSEHRRFGSWAMGYQSGRSLDPQVSAWFGSPEALRPPEGSMSSELLTRFSAR